ncbi:uncharacterized protein BDR25DRAFT_361805 [Lindgomyces ingoldianus]|uniref:Uncharacterized protein n=1 Tax=Lindgomyces ingoldianus TaxID=673940 RepID=A0ACB6QDT2_9PLEO|nr:uncharacterized protein BDR25DRAFT_361805 [Lindgomyces ingoldianus]KAF2464301.1 hypothetical protein BDR25DRAFT_361805 [Lindgomyces ingoldianus]
MNYERSDVLWRSYGETPSSRLIGQPIAEPSSSHLLIGAIFLIQHLNIFGSHVYCAILPTYPTFASTLSSTLTLVWSIFTIVMHMTRTVRLCHPRGSPGLLKGTFVASPHNRAFAWRNPLSRKKTLARTFSISSSASHPWESGRESPELRRRANWHSYIRACVDEHNNNKWGFLIYRCDYSSEDAWAKFMSIYQWNMREALEVLKATDLLPSLEWTVKEDRKTLDQASVDQVREIFKSWVEGDEAKEELRDAPHPGPSRYVRYTYCVHVDADAIDSVVNRAPQPPKSDHKNIGYVNLVRLRPSDMIPYGGLPIDPEDEEHDKDEGDDNFVKVGLSSLDPERYGTLESAYFWDLMTRYRRKEDVVLANEPSLPTFPYLMV